MIVNHGSWFDEHLKYHSLSSLFSIDSCAPFCGHDRDRPHKRRESDLRKSVTPHDPHSTHHEMPPQTSRALFQRRMNFEEIVIRIPILIAEQRKPWIMLIIIFKYRQFKNVLEYVL